MERITKSPCGAYRLLAAICGLNKLETDELLQRKGLLRPAHIRRCLSCGAEVEPYNQYCSACRIIPVTCEVCGHIVPRHRTDVITRSKLDYQHQFCSRHCLGKRMGLLNRDRTAKRDNTDTV